MFYKGFHFLVYPQPSYLASSWGLNEKPFCFCLISHTGLWRVATFVQMYAMQLGCNSPIHHIITDDNPTPFYSPFLCLEFSQDRLVPLLFQKVFCIFEWPEVVWAGAIQLLW